MSEFFKFLSALNCLMAASALFLSLKPMITPSSRAVVLDDIFLCREDHFPNSAGWIKASPGATSLFLRSPYLDKTKSTSQVTLDTFQDMAALEIDGGGPKIFVGVIKGKPYMGVISENGRMFHPVILGQPVLVGSQLFPHPFVKDLQGGLGMQRVLVSHLLGNVP
jgi:hypothetical protein